MAKFIARITLVRVGSGVPASKTLYKAKKSKRKRREEKRERRLRRLLGVSSSSKLFPAMGRRRRRNGSLRRGLRDINRRLSKLL
ncbi:MAG: hypothetical protein R3B09_27020 [Nannocystaceae bacterium]